MAGVIKPRLAKGTRDFTPSDMKLRNFIIETIKKQFEVFGFNQIETPAVENLETLTGKYGTEGDQLIFKILNSGDYLKDVNSDFLNSRDSEKMIPEISEKALRYDLTVPFARYVVQHRNEIAFPFRRFQIQPVWRADRPQKGRYREFYQCDADIIGSNSLMLEGELISLMNGVFSDLKIPSEIRINSRKILLGFCESNGLEDQFLVFTTLLDKLDKKPWADLKEDFKSSGFKDEVMVDIEKLISFKGKDLNVENIQNFAKNWGESAEMLRGIDELNQIANYLKVMKIDFVNVVFDPSLARGLNYYTGAIIEVVAENVSMGSICGGGRYDNLTGMFGMPDVSGVGISFGIDRIYDILKDQKDESIASSRIHIVMMNFGSAENYSINLLLKLRSVGISSEFYPDDHKLQKQFKYADQIGASHVIMAGTEELGKGVFKVKDLKSGEQKELSESEMITMFSEISR